MTGLYLTARQRECLNLGIVEVFHNNTAQLNVHPAVRKVEQKFPTSPVIVNCSTNRVKIHSVSRKQEGLNPTLLISTPGTYSF